MITSTVFTSRADFSSAETIRNALCEALGYADAPEWVLTWYPTAFIRHFFKRRATNVDTANAIMGRMFNDHNILWDGNLHEAVGALAVAEAMGFRFETHRETISMFRGLHKVLRRSGYWGVSEIECWKRVLTAITGRKAPGGGEEFLEDYDTLKVPSWYAPLCVELMSSMGLEQIDGAVIIPFSDGDEVDAVRFDARSIGSVIEAVCSMGVGESHIRKFIKAHGLRRFLRLRECYAEALMSRSAFMFLGSRPKFIRELSIEQVETLMLEWNEAGCPHLERFIELGGTAEAYADHEETERKKREQAKAAALEARAAKAAAPRPAQPIKITRPEPKPVEYVPDGLDWDWIMAELEVEDTFPDLDPVLVRVIIVHGLLRQGDRMSSMDNLPERDRKRLWKECRRGINCDRRTFERACGKLVGKGLVRFKGGKYSLVPQTNNTMPIHELHEQIRFLSGRHAA